MIIGIELEGFECGVLLEGIGPGFVITQSRKRDPCGLGGIYKKRSQWITIQNI